MKSPLRAQRDSLTIRPARLEDLQRIVVIEHESFSSPWSTWSLRQEILKDGAIYLAALVGNDMVGYAGMWIAADEAHIGTLAVAPERRRQGIGEALILALLESARSARVKRVVLEYRVSNEPAANLYSKLGFSQTRIRERYYHDNGEDAVEVIFDDLDTPSTQERLATLRRQWEMRHGGSFADRR